MKVDDEVVLRGDINAFKAEVGKGEETEERGLPVGTEGVVTEVYKTGGGIVRFGDIKVLMMDLDKSVVKKE